ncbi:MAG: hypothetical protein R6W06_02615 [Prochlorococcaceae cyanobacterium]
MQTASTCFHCQQWFSRYPGYAIAVAEASQALAVAADLRRALLLRLTGGPA